MPITRLLALLALLLATGVAISAPATAQDADVPQCSDGIDNDADNAIDGADAGCLDGSDRDETDSPYGGIQFETRPLPVVTLQATVSRNGTVDVKRLLIRADRGARVDITCKGRRCPVKSQSRTMLTSRIRMKTFETRLRPKMVFEIRVGRTAQLGKFVRYTLRKGKQPVRQDACLSKLDRKVGKCFLG